MNGYFAKNNYLFLIALIATLVSISWLALAPDFEPVVTSLLGFITCIGFRPKDWGVIRHRDPIDFDSRNIEALNSNSVNENVSPHNKTESKFYWGEKTVTQKDKSIEFYIPNPEYSYNDWDRVPIRVVMSSLSNTYGVNQNFLYAYIPDKPPVCFYQFEAICAEMTSIDIDDDGNPEFLLGYKCGAHSEGIKVFKLDKSLNFQLIEGSDIGSDLPLITWGRSSKNVFFINTYSRNWGEDREKWHSKYEMFTLQSLKFELKTTAKVKWKSL